jgi:hypothetical protein
MAAALRRSVRYNAAAVSFVGTFIGASRTGSQVMAGLLVILIYAVVGAMVVALGALLYARSVSSRKTYCCPQCGERVSVELMKAGRCNVCGAPLRDEMRKNTQ